MNGHDFLAVGLTNAALATVIAVAGGLLMRFWTNPHVASVVWLAVLLKLVTPPIVALPVAYVSNPSRSQDYGLNEQAHDEAPITAPLSVSIDATGDVKTSHEPVEAPKPVFTPSDAVPAIVPLPVADLVGRAFQPVPDDFPTLESTPLPAKDEHAADGRAGMPLRQHEDAAPAADAALLLGRAGKPVLLAVWITGTVLVGLITFIRALMFHRMLKQATAINHELQRAAVRVASRLGLKRCPVVRSVAASVGPMVWAGSLSPLVIVPRPLWDSLGEDERETLLAHELAHVVRRDHVVRRFEAIVLALYWWLPTAWLAVRRREAAAETCCDALVLSHYPDRPQAYAEALLTAVTILSTDRTPALASGLGRASELKERLTMIVHDRVPQRPGRLVRWGVLFVATLTLAVGATLQPEHAAQASDAAPAVPASDPTEHAAPASSPLPRPIPAESASAVEGITRTPTVAIDEILFFHAEWALHAQAMKAVVEKLRKEGLPFRMIDVDREKELATSMHIDSIPTLVTMRNGKEVDRTVGAKTEKSLRAFVKRHPLAAPGDSLSRETRSKIIDGLIAVVQDEKQPADVKAQSMRSLGNVAKGTDEAGRVEQLLTDVATASNDAGVAVAAGEALFALGSSKGVELMWHALQSSDDTGTQQAIVRWLDERHATPPTAETIRTLAHVADRYLQSKPLDASRPDVFLFSANQLLQRTVTNVDGVRRVIEAIETTPQPSKEMPEEGEGAMGERAGSPSHARTNILLPLLAETQPATDEIAAVLVETLSHNDSDIRKAAAKALGNYKAEETKPR